MVRKQKQWGTAGLRASVCGRSHACRRTSVYVLRCLDADGVWCVEHSVDHPFEGGLRHIEPHADEGLQQGDLGLHLRPAILGLEEIERCHRCSSGSSGLFECGGC